MKRLFLLFFFCISVLALHAQTRDTSLVKSDTVSVRTTVVKDTSYIRRRANKAAIFSAILPGLGQAYNKKYWKIPILYGGIYVLYASIKFNNDAYQDFKSSYIQRLNYLKGIGEPDKYITLFPDANSLVVRKDYYRRTRDLMYIFSGALYILNIVDAYVDAHLANFDVGDNLTLKATPVIQYTYSSQPVASMAVSLSFK